MSKRHAHKRKNATKKQSNALFVAVFFAVSLLAGAGLAHTLVTNVPADVSDDGGFDWGDDNTTFCCVEGSCVADPSCSDTYDQCVSSCEPSGGDDFGGNDFGGDDFGGNDGGTTTSAPPSSVQSSSRASTGAQTSSRTSTAQQQSAGGGSSFDDIPDFPSSPTYEQPSSPDPTFKFPDIAPNTFEAEAAADLYARGIIRGYSDGTFKGGNPVTRAEAAKFLMLAKYGNVPAAPNITIFPDVPSTEWFASYVLQAAATSVIKGYPDGHFRPGNPVNTAEFTKMVDVTFGFETDLPYRFKDVYSTDWYAPYVGAAEKIRLYPNRYDWFVAERPLTRAEVAIAIFRALKTQN